VTDTADDPRHRIARVLQEAIERHTRGDLAAAEASYTAILEEFPQHFSALHLLGVVRSQQNLHYRSW
jgi:hypothetical protein